MEADYNSLQARELLTLNRIAEIMAESVDITQAVPRVLELLENTLGMHYATLGLLDNGAGEVTIDVGAGLTKEQVGRGRYSLGEGVVGKVAESGIAAVIPSVANCPQFLNRTGLRKRGDSSFICVPVILGKDVLGVIWADGDSKEERELHENARFLGVVAAMLAQAIKSRILMRESQESLRKENEQLRGELRSRLNIRNLIGKSREMRIVLDQIAQVAGSSSTVLINGETGTGKELVAQALHYNGSRADKPFIRVNCAALPESLIESELFGHEKGAFTGAIAARKGRFEMADGGTLFLDEIGDISPLIQVKLLRVLQEREFERVGGNKTIKVDVRVVAATHRDLFAMMKRDEFRGDLFYRINVFPIYLLPLRKRLSDLPLLVEHFLAKYSNEAGKTITSISSEVQEIMARHHWPGNVRELENYIEHAVILARGPVILPEHLPASLRLPEENEASSLDLDYKTLVDNFERGVLTEALRATHGNITRAAERLRTTPRVIAYRVRQLGIAMEYGD